MIETIRAVYRALRLRAGRDAGDRIYRRARQVPARPGPPERRRVLVPGRRRAVAVAALRPDRAARALRRGEFPDTWPSPIAAIATAGCSATRSRDRAASASSCSSMPTRSARPRMAADAEMCMMAADTMEALGIQRGQYVVKVNNRKVLDGVMESSARRRRQCRQAAHRAARDRQARSSWRRRRASCCSAKAARTRAATSPRAPAERRRKSSRSCDCSASSRMRGEHWQLGSDECRRSSEGCIRRSRSGASIANS